MTIDLQSQATDGTHGAIWEALPAIEYLLHHLEKLKESIPKPKRRIREFVMNSWSLLQKYYNLTDKNHGILHLSEFISPQPTPPPPPKKRRRLRRTQSSSIAQQLNTAQPLMSNSLHKALVRSLRQGKAVPEIQTSCTSRSRKNGG
jgi:hypothetical protein